MKLILGDSIAYQAASHEDPKNPGVVKKVLATFEDLQLGQVQMLNWAWLAPGKSFQAHYHEDMQEAFIIVEGRVQMTVTGEEFHLQRGDAILISPHEVHSMVNNSSTDAHYIVFGITSGQDGKTVVV